MDDTDQPGDNTHNHKECDTEGNFDSISVIPGLRSLPKHMHENHDNELHVIQGFHQIVFPIMEWPHYKSEQKASHLNLHENDHFRPEHEF